MKRLFDKIVASALGFLKKVPGLKGAMARYEAAYYQWGERSYLLQSLQDARLDIDASTRKELQRKHRYWVSNSEIVQRIRSLFIQFSVGTCGLQCVPNSSDETWNEANADSFQQWAEEPELSSRLPLSQLQIQWAGALFDDGEVFIYKTVDAMGKPAIQTIEAHRVETPPDMMSGEGKTIIDGIGLKQIYVKGKAVSVGKPDVYYIRDEHDNQAYIPIPARNILHIFKSRRPGMMRGIPEGFSCMNTLHDYEDLHKLEMQAARMASAIGNVETNATGEIDPAATRRSRINISSQNQAGQPVLKNADQFYKVTLGTQHFALRAGDTLKQFQVDRPSIVTQQYWDLLASQICSGYNVPKLLVIPFSLQGTVTRADLDVSANAFRANFELLAAAVKALYEWRTSWAVKFDRSMDGNAPVDFPKVVIRPPRAPNVDIGYTAQALALELEIGAKTLQDVYAEKQQDWRVQLRQIAETEQFIDQLAAEYGVDASRIATKAIKTAGKQTGGSGEDPASGEARKSISVT